jgi:hypothetical protein
MEMLVRLSLNFIISADTQGGLAITLCILLFFPAGRYLQKAACGIWLQSEEEVVLAGILFSLMFIRDIICNRKIDDIIPT